MIVLSETTGLISIYIAEMFLMLPSFKVVQAVMSARVGGEDLFSLYIYIENFKKSSCQKPQDPFHYNLAKMFPWWPSTKIVQVIVICQKTWLLAGGAYFPYISIYRKLKNLLVRNQWTDFNITWQECFFGDPLSRLFKLSWFVKKHGR